MKYIIICLVTLLATSTSFCNEDRSPIMESAHCVIVFLESKTGKEESLKDALLTIAEKSREESSCLEYRVHQDGANPTKFALYEKWVSPELHQKQFEKPYILEFASQAKDLLSKPYEGLFGKELDH